MRDLIHNDDLKRVFAGAAGIAVVGLMLGGFMQPQLRDDFGGPRIEMGFAGARGHGAYDQSTVWTSYQGQVPDYVVGTDWTRPVAYADPVVVVETVDEAPPQAGTGDQVEVAQTAWSEPERPPVSYPSTSGGAPYHADLPAPPGPPEDDDEPPVAG